jgi:hypothetical protein
MMGDVVDASKHTLYTERDRQRLVDGSIIVEKDLIMLKIYAGVMRR